MESIQYTAPETVELRSVPTPRIGDREVLVAVEACGLCGTDLLKLFHGRLKPPVPLGHEAAGRIAAVGPRVQGFAVGDRVSVAHHVPCFECRYCRRGSASMCRQFKATNLDPGGFSQYARVSELHVRHTLLKIPPHVDFAAASQTEPLACVLRNLRRLNLHAQDAAVIVGLGSIGLLTGQVLRAREVAVIGLDLDPGRRKIAKQAGIEYVFPRFDDTARKRIKALTDSRGADAAIFTAGPAELVPQGLEWIRDGGTLNILASFPSPLAALDLNRLYHREINIVASYSAAPEDLHEALRLIAAGRIDMTPHIRHAFPLDRFHDAVARVRSRRILKAILLPQESGARRRKTAKAAR